jgi:2-succinyl-5-enolpyruvyl-6-hydroxy-3-cyclohexene-1-carboxylate synthase
MNPSTAFATVLVDELVRCGLREAVIAPGSRSAPLAMALHSRSHTGAGAGGGPGLRLHVRVDERSASFLALGLAKASGRPVAVVCTSGTAAAHFHAAVIEADEAGVPLLVLTADRPPELRGTGANQTIDQVKLYGSAVRWFCEAGVAEDRPEQAAYWRSLTGRAWSAAAGSAGGYPGPVHLNLAFRDPLVPDVPDTLPLAGESAAADRAEMALSPTAPGGRTAGRPWTEIAGPAQSGLPELVMDWTERGVVIAGDGTADPAALVRLAGRAGWPLLAEPSSGARHGPTALGRYQYLLDSPDFLAGMRPDVVVSAGRPGLTRGQLALLHAASLAGRHVVLLQGAGRWSDPARTATDVAGRVVLRGGPQQPLRTGWLRAWLAADAAVRQAADRTLAAEGGLSEPLLARDLAAALPPGALLWAASSMPARDLDRQMTPRSDVRVLASRGASGIDGLVSAAIGAALAHQADGGGPAVALLGDLALLHDAPGLVLGPAEPRPDLCLVVVNNDGGGIFSMLEQAAYPESFERVFGTPHGADFGALAAAAGLPHQRLEHAAHLHATLAGGGLRMVEVRTDRSEGAKLRAAISQACAIALATALSQ